MFDDSDHPSCLAIVTLTQKLAVVVSLWGDQVGLREPSLTDSQLRW